MCTRCLALENWWFCFLSRKGVVRKSPNSGTLTFYALITGDPVSSIGGISVGLVWTIDRLWSKSARAVQSCWYLDTFITSFLVVPFASSTVEAIALHSVQFTLSVTPIQIILILGASSAVPLDMMYWGFTLHLPWVITSQLKYLYVSYHFALHGWLHDPRLFKTRWVLNQMQWLSTYQDMIFPMWHCSALFL